MSYTTKKIGVRTTDGLTVKEELVVAEAFYPGHLLEIDSNKKFKKHSGAAAQVVPVIVAKEGLMQGDDVDEVFVVGDQAEAWICGPGSIVNIRVADGQTIAIGTYVESAGDGTINPYSAGSKFGIALSACDMSGSSGVDPSPPFAAILIG